MRRAQSRHAIRTTRNQVLVQTRPINARTARSASTGTVLRVSSSKAHGCPLTESNQTTTEGNRERAVTDSERNGRGLSEYDGDAASMQAEHQGAAGRADTSRADSNRHGVGPARSAMAIPLGISPPCR